MSYLGLKTKKQETNFLSPMYQWINESLKTVPWNEESDTIYQWGVYKENSRYVIKREIRLSSGKKTWQRFKKSFYKEFENDPDKLKDLAIFLNHKNPSVERAKSDFEKRLALGGSIKDYEDFFKKVRDEFLNEDKKDINNRLVCFFNYGVTFFRKLSENPTDWYTYQKDWGKYLLNRADNLDPKLRIYKKGVLRSKSTLEKTIWMMNKYLEYLHRQNSKKYPNIELKPITNAQFKRHEQHRELKNANRKRQKVAKKDLARILTALQSDPQLRRLLLCYHFGLRRSESISLDTEKDMFKDHILIQSQYKMDKEKNLHRAPTKTRSKRKIAWEASSLSAQEVFEILETTQPISPDKMTRRWANMMIELKITKVMHKDGEEIVVPKYDIHCLRHTAAYEWVNGDRKDENGENWSIKACMEFLGHKSIQTTNKYIQSTREYSSEKFKPTLKLIKKVQQKIAS